MARRHLFDTNICIYIARHNPPPVRARFERLTADELAMSVIALGEPRHGDGGGDRPGVRRRQVNHPRFLDCAPLSTLTVRPADERSVKPDEVW